MEIEKKFLVKKLPDDLDQLKAVTIEQGYLCTKPVVRIRQMGDEYWLTYKSKTDAPQSKDTCVNQEVELPLTEESYIHLRKKVDGILIQKTRYRMAYQAHVIELDLFHGAYEGLVIAEVEFATLTEAEQFTGPDWFGENVSGDYHYSNAFLSCGNTQRCHTTV